MSTPDNGAPQGSQRPDAAYPSTYPLAETSAPPQPDWTAPSSASAAPLAPQPPALALPPPPGAYPSSPAYPLPLPPTTVPALVPAWPAYPPYGYGYLPAPYYPPPITDPGSGAAVASLILGISSAFVTFLIFVPCLPVLALGAAIAGIVTGAIGLKSTARHGMAVGGLVTSVIALALGLGLIVGYILFDVILLSGMPPST